jgi:hypothetical protein
MLNEHCLGPVACCVYTVPIRALDHQKTTKLGHTVTYIDEQKLELVQNRLFSQAVLMRRVEVLLV